jgi:hypothetical protein
MPYRPSSVARLLKSAQEGRLPLRPPPAHPRRSKEHAPAEKSPEWHAHESTPALKATISDTQTAASNEWGERSPSWSTAAAPVSTSPTAPSTPRIELARSYVDDYFQLVLAHIHDSDRQQKNAEDAACSVQDSIS